MEKRPFNPVHKFTEKILEELMHGFGYDEETAKSSLADSLYSEMVEEKPNFVLHYSPYYWAKEIYDEEHIEHNNLVKY